MERISSANAPPTDAPMATALVVSSGVVTRVRCGGGMGGDEEVECVFVHIKRTLKSPCH